MNTSTYSKGEYSVSCEEAHGVCGVKCRIVGRDMCAALGQVAELVVVGCSTTSSADCRSVAADDGYWMLDAGAGISHSSALVSGVQGTCSVCHRCRGD